MKDPKNTTEKKLDTSLPGREEEVINNESQIVNAEPIKTVLTKDDDLSITAEQTYTEGMQNNSDTSVNIE